MTWIITPTPTVGLAVVGQQAKFPLQRIFCVGRNYAEHAQEMGHSGRDDPFFFAKSAQTYFPLSSDRTALWPYPAHSNNVQHEVELVVALSQGGRNLSVEQARACIFGYAIGIDMTCRDLQAQAKQQGRPWETSKAFDASAPIGPLSLRSQVGELNQGAIQLLVNGELRQQGDLTQMLWPVDEAIAYLSTLFTLQAGDVLMTGTPAGVSTLHEDDMVVARIEGLGELSLQVGAAV